MLLDEYQVILNDITVLSREAADHYREDANKLDGDNPELARLFLELADHRDLVAEGIQTMLRSLDALPREPDPERELLDELIEHASANLSSDGASVFAQARATQEQKIIEHLEQAIALDTLSEDHRQELRGYLDRSKSDLERLQPHYSAS